MLLEVAFADTPKERRMIVIYVRKIVTRNHILLDYFTGRNILMLLVVLLGFSLLDLMVFLVTSHHSVFVLNFLI